MIETAFNGGSQTVWTLVAVIVGWLIGILTGRMSKKS